MKMFFIGRESTVTEFHFLVLTNNQSGNIKKDQSDLRVKQDCEVHITFPEIELHIPSTNHCMFRFASVIGNSVRKSIYFWKMAILTHSLQISVKP